MNGLQVQQVAQLLDNSSPGCAKRQLTQRLAGAETPIALGGCNA